MNRNEFKDIFDSVVDKVDSLLNKKNDDYAKEGDFMHNFKELGMDMDMTALST